jgi:hypothetical protein
LAVTGLLLLAILVTACGSAAPEEAVSPPQPKLVYFYAEW